MRVRILVISAVAVLYLTLTAIPALAIAPEITGFGPTSGVVGDDVVITGLGFDTATAVTFDGVSAPFMIDSPMQITATVPSGATTGYIGVENPEGAALTTEAFRVIRPPVIRTFSPHRQVVGRWVEVSGRNLGSVTDAWFGQAQAGFRIISNARLEMRVPDGFRRAHIRVRNPAGVTVSDDALRVYKLRHGTRITLQLGRHLFARGEVDSQGADDFCNDSRRLTVQRKVSDFNWRTIKRTESWPNGNFATRIPDRPGTYRVLVGTKQNSQHICFSAASNTETHGHETGGSGGGGGGSCDPSYPGVCIPPPPPDLDCGQIPYTNFTVVGSDPHAFDGDNDGVGCET